MLANLPLEKIFKVALKNGGTFADIFFESTTETSITADNNRIEQVISGSDSGLGLRVLQNGKTVYGYTNDLSEKSVIQLASSIAEAVRGDEWTADINFIRRSPAPVRAVQKKPDSIPLEVKTALIKNANSVAWGFDDRVKQASIVYKDVVRNISIANSLGELADDEKIDTLFKITVVASDGKEVQTGIEPIGAFSGFELFDRYHPEDLVKTACRRAITMLGARPAPTGAMPVVFSSEAGGTMVHEAVGHGLEADLALGGFSIYRNRIGKRVASPLITIIDDATLPMRRGSFLFDDEGSPAQKTVLIEKGVLKGYMHNRITAEKFGATSTGNGRRESYRFRPSVRMTNTIIEPGTDDPASIIKDTDRGLYVKKMGGGQVNTITGDFVFGVQEGYIIKNGAISDAVRGATLTGNGPEALSLIDRVGSDLGFSIGSCGKDRQLVPVSSAQPTLRIPRLIIGGTL